MESQGTGSGRAVEGQWKGSGRSSKGSGRSVGGQWEVRESGTWGARAAPSRWGASVACHPGERPAIRGDQGHRDGRTVHVCSTIIRGDQGHRDGRTVHVCSTIIRGDQGHRDGRTVHVCCVDYLEGSPAGPAPPPLAVHPPEGRGAERAAPFTAKGSGGAGQRRCLLPPLSRRRQLAQRPRRRQIPATPPQSEVIRAMHLEGSLQL